MKIHNSTSETLPTVENTEFPHMKKLILITQKFGAFIGFYDGKHFRTSYAEILENVTHWAEFKPEIEE
jgi:hypothetical protein